MQQGSCLCGAVRYRIDGDFDQFFMCHCSRCRKGTGSAHGANLFSTSAQLHWLQGEHNIRCFQLPETRHRRAFCQTCGSPVPQQQSSGDHHFLLVPAGSLDTTAPLPPATHIFTASKAGWDTAPTGGRCFAELP